MHAADHSGPGTTPASSEPALRYIITRPCLAEGSLRLLKYLQPLFPIDGPVTLHDGKGEQFGATVELGRGRLTGVGELYRAHNMGVNDVLMLSPTEEGHYHVECVVKPHARLTTPPPERPAAVPLVTEKRVVIHATPHVREVRTERVTGGPGDVATSTSASRASSGQSDTQPVPGQSITGQALTGGQSLSKPASPGPARPATAQAARHSLNEGVRPSEGHTRPAPAAGRPQGVQATPTQSTPPRGSAPLTSLTARMQHSGTPTRTVQISGSQIFVTLIQMNFTSSALKVSAVPQNAVQTQAIQSRPTPAPAVQAMSAPVALLDTQAAPAQPVTRPVSEAEPTHNPEDQLAALARLTGYTCDHLGSGVVRLRAELGTHGYSVLIATTPQALTTPEWRENCDYMALLTQEDERPQGIPRFTYAALGALLEHARLAPLTPIDLRGYWNTGSFDQESVESVAELVSAHLTQRGSFSHVLLTLAQQPAHSLVHLPRLAERLGSGVNTAELTSILETLSRAPFLALTPLPNGQYYLRSDVRDLLQEFGAYAEGMQRRLRPATVTRS